MREPAMQATIVPHRLVHAAAMMHHEDDWKTLPWENSCAACHTTDFRDGDHGFMEPGIGCEECHGPGSRHVASPTKDGIFTFTGRTAAEEVTVCASCHLQEGHSQRTGLSYPDGYRPGGSLFDDYVFHMTEDKDRPQIAIDTFLAWHPEAPVLLRSGQIAFEKPRR